MWLWIIIGVGAAIYFFLNWLASDTGSSSKSKTSSASTKKEESIDDMIKKLEKKVSSSETKADSNKENNASNNSKDTSNDHSRVIERTRLFVNLCREIDKWGYGYGYYVIKIQKSPSDLSYFYIRHTFHDVDDLLFAYDSLKKGDDRMVKYYYDKIISTLPTTINKQDFFLQDFSDFCDSLRREGLELETYAYQGRFLWNKFTRDGCNDMIIEQYVGSCIGREAEMVYTNLKNEINNLTK